LQRLEVVLDVGVDALVQVGEFLVNLAIAVAGLEEFQVPGAFLRDAEAGKDPDCDPGEHGVAPWCPCAVLDESGWHTEHVGDDPTPHVALRSALVEHQRERDLQPGC
jgi:hypothetical protein